MKARSGQGQGKVREISGQVQSKIRARSRKGHQSKVKARSRQGKDKVKHNLNRNYNLMGFDTIEINPILPGRGTKF